MSELPVGTYVQMRWRNRDQIWQIAETSDGRHAIKGVEQPDEIPDGVMIHPAKWEEDRIVPKKGKKPFIYKQPPRWRSGVLCDNRAGQPALLEPQCNGQHDAELVFVHSPRIGTKGYDEAGQLLQEGDFNGVRDFFKALDIRRTNLCRECGRAFMQPGRQLLGGLAERSGMIHPLRP